MYDIGISTTAPEKDLHHFKLLSQVYWHGVNHDRSMVYELFAIREVNRTQSERWPGYLHLDDLSPKGLVLYMARMLLKCQGRLMNKHLLLVAFHDINLVPFD